MDVAPRYTSPSQVTGDKMSAQNEIRGLMSLFSFVRVVEAGSFAEAARRAGTTSSAMSKSIARFEQRHGVRLLHRTTHSLSLTQEGERLLEGARRLLQDAERLGASLTEGDEPIARGRVKVSLPGSFAHACVLPYLSEFRASNPEIELDLSLEDSLVDLGAEGVDIAVRAGEVDRQPGHVATRLLSYPYVLCAAPEYLDAHPAPSAPSDLATHRHIVFRNKGNGQLLNWQFRSPAADQRQVRIQPNTHMIVDDGAAAWTLVRQGFGLTWAPGWLGLDDLRSGRVVEVMSDWRMPDFHLFAVRLQRKNTPARTRVVLDFLRMLVPRWQHVQ